MIRNVQIRVPDELKIRLDVILARRQLSIQRLLADYITQYVEQSEQEPPQPLQQPTSEE